MFFILNLLKPDCDDNKISIFSEGRVYWSTFEQIVNELLNKKCPVTFYTMDKSDPVFKLKNEFLKVVYIGKGGFAFFKISNLKAKILLSTTPNIGTLGYPIKRSKNITSLIHVFHSLGDYAYAWYHKYSLDFYDEVIVPNNFIEKQIRFIEKLRNLKNKKIILGGTPYIDKIYKENVKNKINSNKQKTIIIAPSWGSKGLFKYYDAKLIRNLSLCGYKIIIRPHPQSIKDEKNMLNDIKEQTKDLKNIIWDEIGNNDYFKQSDIMISDTSSVRLDFSILYNKPVITLKTPVCDISQYEYSDLIYLLKNSTTDTDIGVKIDINEIKNISKIVTNLVNSANLDYEKVKNKNVVNFGNSAKVISDYLIKRLKELE